MKNTTNVFLEGIITDQNPLTMPETALTSALNAAVVTGNGNEGILLNDMGNTLIKDSITGNIMALNDGFIPLGMKEHGGVLYIASYNPDTNLGELGSIPSPILHYTYSTSPSKILEKVSISDISGTGEVSQRINSNIIYLSDHIFHGGDKFIVNLNLDLENTTYTTREINSPRQRRSRQTTTRAEVRIVNRAVLTESFPVITQFNNNGVLKKGWYSVQLYAITGAGKEILLSDVMSTPQLYINADQTIITSDYWFLNGNISDLDVNSTRSNQRLFRTYPNIPAGRLGIKFVPEYHKEINFISNTTYDEGLPQVIINPDNTDTNWVVIHGFTYDADCPILPDQIKISCGGLKLYDKIGGQELGSEVTFTITPDAAYENTNSSYRNTHKFQSKGDYSITKQPNSTLYTISKFLPLPSVSSYDPYIVENQDLKNCDGLFAIEISDLNTDIKFDVLLLVKTPDGSGYVEYRDPSWKGLPIFNPALQLFEGDVNLEFVDLYLDPSKSRSDTFDVELFKNSAQKCFLVDADDDILLFDETTKKYVKKNSVEQTHIHTLAEYSDMKSWIYPQYKTGSAVRLDFKDTLFIWRDLEEMWTGEGWHRILKEDVGFVICSELPIVTGWSNSEHTKAASRNLLLPIISDHTLECARKLLLFFELHTNKYNLTPADLKEYSLYSVNLNIVNYADGLNSYMTDLRFFLSGVISNAFVSYAGSGVLLNELFNATDYQYGFETFWSKDALNGDNALAMWSDSDLYIDTSESNNLQGIQSALAIHQILADSPEYHIIIPWNRTRDYMSLVQWNDYTYRMVGYLEIPYITYSNQGANHVNVGFTKLLLKRCPGYCENNLNLLLKFIDFKYSLDYLYTSNLAFSLLNNTSSPGIKYYWMAHSANDAVVTRFHHLIDPPGDYIVSVKLKQTHVDDINLDLEIRKDTHTKAINYVPSTTLLGSDSKVSIDIYNTDKYSEFELDITNKNDNEWDKKYIQSVVITPQLFIEVPTGGLTRNYKSDWEIAKQITFELKGVYSHNGSDILTLYNVDLKNLLLNSSSENVKDETLLDILLGDSKTIYPEELKSPAGIRIEGTLTRGILLPTSGGMMRIAANPTILNPVTDSSYCGINSFQAIEGYAQIGVSEKCFTFNNIAMDGPGIYVLNVNYYHPQRFTTGSPNSLLCLHINENEQGYNFGNRGYIAFYTPSNYISLKIICKNNYANKPFYIKNIGLYKVNIQADGTLLNKISTLIDQYSGAGVKVLTDEHHESIILNSVYCIKETCGGAKVGCMDTEFGGFCELPLFSYQTCIGYYEIKNTDTKDKAHVNFEFVPMLNSKIEDQIIRKTAEYDS